MSYGQNLVHGERTSLSRVGPYRFCSGGTLYKPSWWYRFGYRFRVGPYRFCSDGYPTTLSILLWSYLILSDTHIYTRKKPWILWSYGTGSEPHLGTKPFPPQTAGPGTRCKTSLTPARSPEVVKLHDGNDNDSMATLRFPGTKKKCDM